MTTAIYPGSFNPWHKGHTDILEKALRIFDNVIVARGINTDKSANSMSLIETIEQEIPRRYIGKITVVEYASLLADYIRIVPNITAIVRGLRNGADLEYEKAMQYWNEDLINSCSRNKIPTVYFICDREFVHISSSAIREIREFRK